MQCCTMEICSNLQIGKTIIVMHYAMLLDHLNEKEELKRKKKKKAQTGTQENSAKTTRAIPQSNCAKKSCMNLAFNWLLASYISRVWSHLIYSSLQI